MTDCPLGSYYCAILNPAWQWMAEVNKNGITASVGPQICSPKCLRWRLGLTGIIGGS